MNIKNNNLRKIRREKDLTQEYMAFELGISQKAYSDIQNGKTKINQNWEFKNKKSQTVGLGLKDYLSHDN